MYNKVLLSILAITMTACTPMQLNTWEEITGQSISPTDRAVLEDLPDVDMRLPDGRQIAPDGRIIGSKAPDWSRCPEHYNSAIAAGWSHDQWDKLDYIIWRESRCFSNVHNTKGRDDSYGIMQINLKAHRSWVRPLVNGDFNSLFDPETNLRIAKVLYTKAQEYYGCGFQPWKTTKQKHWCN